MADVIFALALAGIASASFVAIVWIVEFAQVAFWRWAIRNSSHCRLAGCLCPCHDDRESAESQLEASARHLGLRP